MTYDPEKYEEFNPAECHPTRSNCQLLDPELFSEDSPVLDGVIFQERHNYWDGPISGICEVNGQKFYFDTIVESVWRYYNKQSKTTHLGKKFQRMSRLWRIYAVYDLPLKELKNIPTDAEERANWLLNEADILGIFWNFTARYRENEERCRGRISWLKMFRKRKRQQEEV